MADPIAAPACSGSLCAVGITFAVARTVEMKSRAAIAKPSNKSFCHKSNRDVFAHALKADRNHRSIRSISLYDRQEFHLMPDKFHFMPDKFH
jgi:hypothetical protein